MKIQVSKVFNDIYSNYNPSSKDKQGFVLEGGSRSSKTWSIIQFLIVYCQQNTGKKITCARAKYSWLKPSILADFVEILLKYKLYNIDDHNRTDSIYNLFENQISFIGLDDKQKLHGRRQDIFWINEAMESEFADFQQLNQRTSELFILDYNPSYTEHWIFNSVITRPDTLLFTSTQLDNPFLDNRIRKEILAYEPTSENIKNGTADDYMWKVYGLGQRAAAKGLIFQNIDWITEFPKDIRYQWGLDFGFTNDPTALTKVGVSSEGLFIELLCYEPIDHATLIDEMLANAGVKKGDRIIGDSADRYNDQEMVKDLRNLGWNIFKANKSNGIKWGIGQIKKNKIHIVSNTNAKREAENYKWREINGICINEPIDKFNHMWDSCRYTYIDMSNSMVPIIW